jgi:hypothetical protein
LAKDALRDGDWAAVGQAVSERLSELRMSASYLSRETGLSPTTIRGLGKPSSSHNRSTLVALSAVLGWRYDYLLNILNRNPDKNIRRPGESPVEAYFESLLHAEVGPMREEVAELVRTVNGMGKQVDVLFQQRQTGTDANADKGKSA